MLEFTLPNSHAMAVMILIVVALILFAREKIPLETTSLVVLVLLSVGFTIFPYEVDGKTLQASDFFLGFGHKALIAVGALMIVGEGLIRTAALEPVGRLLAGDRITTSDSQANLREFARARGGTLFSGDHAVDREHPLQIEGEQLAELVITPGSQLVNMHIGESQLSSRFGLRLLALNRSEESQERKTPGLDNIKLRSGDVLLVQSSMGNLRDLKATTDFLILEGSIQLPSTRKAPIALFAMVGVVVLAAFKILPIEISALLGCLVLIVSGALKRKDAMNALSTQVILIIVSSLAIGTALLKTGGADYLAQLFVYMTFGAPGAVVLGGLMLMMGILTNVVSNNAAAVTGTPIAIGIAQRLGMPLEPFVLAVLFGANLSFATPMAYKI